MVRSIVACKKYAVLCRLMLCRVMQCCVDGNVLTYVVLRCAPPLHVSVVLCCVHICCVVLCCVVLC